MFADHHQHYIINAVGHRIFKTIHDRPDNYEGNCDEKSMLGERHYIMEDVIKKIATYYTSTGQATF